MENKKDPMLNQDWHPEMTEEQIYEALQRDIYEPVGQEYHQYLKELGLTPIKETSDENKIIPPIPPIPPFPPIFITGDDGTKGNGNDNENEELIKQIKKAIKDELEKEDENIVSRITSKRKNNLSKWLSILALVVLLTTGLNISDNTIYNKIINSITTTSVDYSIQETKQTDEITKDIIWNLKMGEMLGLKEGQTFNTNSALTGINKAIGKEFDKENKYAGEYAITGFSITKDGEVLAFIENFNNNAMNEKFGDLIQKSVDEYNATHQDKITVDDVTPVLHFGSNNDITRLGWIKATDVIGDEMVKNYITNLATYKGVEDAHKGNTITITTNNGNVEIPVKDAQGNYYKPGEKVHGSDGKKYIISSLDISEETRTTTETETITDGKKVTFKIVPASVIAGLSLLGAAVVYEIYTQNKNKEFKNAPTFVSHKSEEQAAKFQKAFESALKEHEKNERFEQKLKRIFIYRQVDELRRLTKEDIKKMMVILRMCDIEGYEYNEKDELSFTNGKIYVITHGGKMVDVTEKLSDKIREIGKDNDARAEGLLTEEVLHGKKR